VHHARRDEAAILGLDAALRSLMRWFGWCRQTRTEAQRKRSYDQDRRHQRQRLAGVETRAVIASSIARIAERTGVSVFLGSSRAGRSVTFPNVHGLGPSSGGIHETQGLSIADERRALAPGSADDAAHPRQGARPSRDDTRPRRKSCAVDVLSPSGIRRVKPPYPVHGDARAASSSRETSAHA
jgi:hypothetical protein